MGTSARNRGRVVVAVLIGALAVATVFAYTEWRSEAGTESPANRDSMTRDAGPGVAHDATPVVEAQIQKTGPDIAGAVAEVHRNSSTRDLLVAFVNLLLNSSLEDAVEAEKLLLQRPDSTSVARDYLMGLWKYESAIEVEPDHAANLKRVSEVISMFICRSLDAAAVCSLYADVLDQSFFPMKESDTCEHCRKLNTRHKSHTWISMLTSKQKIASVLIESLVRRGLRSEEQVYLASQAGELRGSLVNFPSLPSDAYSEIMFSSLLAALSQTGNSREYPSISDSVLRSSASLRLKYQAAGVHVSPGSSTEETLQELAKLHDKDSLRRFAQLAVAGFFDSELKNHGEFSGFGLLLSALFERMGADAGFSSISFTVQGYLKAMTAEQLASFWRELESASALYDNESKERLKILYMQGFSAFAAANRSDSVVFVGKFKHSAGLRDYSVKAYADALSDRHFRSAFPLLCDMTFLSERFTLVLEDLQYLFERQLRVNSDNISLTLAASTAYEVIQQRTASGISDSAEAEACAQVLDLLWTGMQLASFCEHDLTSPIGTPKDPKFGIEPSRLESHRFYRGQRYLICVSKTAIILANAPTVIPRVITARVTIDLLQRYADALLAAADQLPERRSNLVGHRDYVLVYLENLKNRSR